MKEGREEKRKRLMEQSMATVSEAFSSPDHAIVQAINTYKEIEKIRGIIHERLEEWYGIYFPELKTGGYDTYADFALAFGSVDELDDAKAEQILGEDGKKIVKEINANKMRPKLEPGEYDAIKALADQQKSLSKLQESLDSFIKDGVAKTMPNFSYLVDYKIAAEMLAKAGSLERLATMPASTIQLLGAEKALFKHLKFGSRPPKYGVLFKLPQFGSANKKQKGKLARAYATKLCIAARADAYTQRFIAKELKESLDKTSKKIMEECK